MNTVILEKPETLKSEMKAFLEHYKYHPTQTGIEQIFLEWLKNKGNIIEHFRLHQNWDEDAMAIVFKDEEYEKQFDKKALQNFAYWVDYRLDEIASEKGEQYINYDWIQSRYADCISYINNIKDTVRRIKETYKDFEIDVDVTVNGETNPYTTIKELKNNVLNIALNETRCTYHFYNRTGKVFLDRETDDLLVNTHNAMDYIAMYVESNTISDIEAQNINSYININAVAGQKLSRIINKICINAGINKYKDMREQTDGSLRDYGYNREFAIVADAINPVKYKRITVISVNPMDYWGMSFGYKWASCHTIDKFDVRVTPDSGHHYNGCYSSGTESYMLDNSSIIYYVIKEDYEGNRYWEEDKINRCVFCINEDGKAILESRVYPDGRDGGDNSLAKQFREVMQRVVSETYSLNNLWKNEKGSSKCRDYTESEGTHYKDYIEYGDGNVSINKDLPAGEFPKMIYIGHSPICPVCGYEHDEEENIICPDCNDNVKCNQCGDEVDTHSTESIRIGDRWFCCDECASEYGYRYCEDDGGYHYEDDLYYCENDEEYHLWDNVYEDARNELFYYGEPEITTEDGRYYSCVENAENDGYRRNFYNDCWYKIDELRWDEYESEWFDPDNSNAIKTEDDNYYMTEESAEYDGYVKTENGEWIHENDAIVVEINDITYYYASEEDAESDGYRKNEDNEWEKVA